VWEEVEEDQETARRIRENPERWWPPSADPLTERPLHGHGPWEEQATTSPTL